MSKAGIGLIGPAVMGQNLVLNMNDHGFTVACSQRQLEELGSPARYSHNR
jgi:6-phosphogluconate dehydrogenase